MITRCLVLVASLAMAHVIHIANVTFVIVDIAEFTSMPKRCPCLSLSRTCLTSAFCAPNTSHFTYDAARDRTSCCFKTLIHL